MSSTQGRSFELEASLFADLAEAGENIRLERREFFIGHLSELQPHLRAEELFAKRRVVVQLGVDSGRHFVKHEPASADEQRVEDDQWARSSFNRMLTKL